MKMTKALRSVLAVVLVISGALWSAGVARADLNNSSATNAQDGNNRSTSTQRGSSKSGDAVGGQVTGVVSSGRTSVDARNTSTDSDVTTGDANGSNHASAFTGLNSTGGPTSVTADINNVKAANLQDGSNRSTSTQSVSATTGDGVAGQVIGVVTGAGGSASIVAANTSTNDSVETGDANGTNNFAAFTGLQDGATTTVTAADITNSCTAFCVNVQSGGNTTTGRQSSTAHTGDGVAGQVIGGVSSGRLSIDARNTSDNVDVSTGNADASNGGAVFTGLNDSSATTTVQAADITGSCTGPATCNNVQSGRNRSTTNQSASATTGDGVGGQVIGAVTSAGGSASIVAANTTTNSDVDTGDATSANSLSAFVGLNHSATTTVQTADITGSCTVGGAGQCFNAQDGDNRFTGSQSATSHTGDGVAGQVLGVVSAGAASVDANNKTDDSSVETGNSKATNAASEFVGLNVTPPGTTVGGTTADISGANANNLQDGGNRKTLSQAADATSGDAVAGEVAGVVTSAGGSASVVLANTSTSIDSTTGETKFANDDSGFVGLNFSVTGPIVVR